MAVFFTNVCKFNDCGQTFPSLRQLIEHIEDAHIGELTSLTHVHTYTGGSIIIVPNKSYRVALANVYGISGLSSFGSLQNKERLVRYKILCLGAQI